jgi:hypothetical protein
MPCERHGAVTPITAQHALALTNQSNVLDLLCVSGYCLECNVFENILTRGILVGRSYEKGRDFRGIWGVYGSYD